MESFFVDFASLASMTREKAEKNVQEALNYLRLDFRNLGAIIGQYHPLEVLKMAAWEERRIARTRAREPLVAASGRLLPVLLQSIIQSTSYDVSHGISSNRNIKDKDWQRIKSLVDDVTKRLIRSIECYTVLVIRSGKLKEESGPAYREALFEEVFPPAEDLERIERLAYMTYAAMQSAEDVVKERYGAAPELLISEMHKVIRRGLEGIDRLSEDASVYKAEVETLMAQKRAADPARIISEEDLVHEIIKENGWESRVARLAGERDDFDLFRPDFAANLPSRTYEALSAAPGTIDIHEMMMKGMWPATVYPFLRFGDMYFSFVSQHIQSYSLRILQETAGLTLRYTEATNEALHLLFRDADEVDVYTFDGNKIDVSILSSLVEVNAFTSPELFQSRIDRRAEERNWRPSLGHKGIIVEPDDFEGLREIADGVFSCSAYFILRSAMDRSLKKEFCRTIFGQLEMPEPTEYDSIIDPDEIENDEKPDDDILSDGITDEYEYDSEDDDEKERAIEEKEKQLEESIPEDYSDYERSSEIEKLAEKYALTNDIIKRDEEMEAEADEYEKELDDDDFSYDDPEAEAPVDDDVDPEAERIYDEAEQEDVYADDSYNDPDQLTFFDELFGDEDTREADKLAEDEFTAEDEEEFEKSEEEAEEFARSEHETLPNSAVSVSAGEVPPQEEDLDDFPCFEEDSSASDTSASEEGAEEEKSSSDRLDAEKIIPFSDDKAEDLPAADDEEAEDVAEEQNVPVQDDSESVSPEEGGNDIPDFGEPEYSASSEPVSSESGEENLGEEAVSSASPQSSDNDEAEGNMEQDTAAEECCSPVPPAEDTDVMSGDPELREEASPEADSDETAEPHGSDEEKPFSQPDSSSEEASTAFPDDPYIPEPVYEEDHSDEAIVPSDEGETTESLIDKGLVKPVELSGGGTVFVMTDAPQETAPESEEEEEKEEAPALELHGILREIAEKLDQESVFLSFLSSTDSEMHEYLEKVIRSSWERQLSDGKDKMFSIYDYSISVIIAADKVNDELRKVSLLNNAGAVMYSRHMESWNALILSINDDFELIDAYEKAITPDSFSASDWKICRVIGQQLIERGK